MSEDKYLFLMYFRVCGGKKECPESFVLHYTPTDPLIVLSQKCGLKLALRFTQPKAPSYLNFILVMLELEFKVEKFVSGHFLFSKWGEPRDVICNPKLI